MTSRDRRRRSSDLLGQHGLQQVALGLAGDRAEVLVPRRLDIECLQRIGQAQRLKSDGRPAFGWPNAKPAFDGHAASTTTQTSNGARRRSAAGPGAAVRQAARVGSAGPWSAGRYRASVPKLASVMQIRNACPGQPDYEMPSNFGSPVSGSMTIRALLVELPGRPSMPISIAAYPRLRRRKGGSPVGPESASRSSRAGS